MMAAKHTKTLKEILFYFENVQLYDWFDIQIKYYRNYYFLNFKSENFRHKIFRGKNTSKEFQFEASLFDLKTSFDYSNKYSWNWKA